MIFILPLIAVFLGYIIALFLKPNSSLSFKLLLAFSGAYLLSVTVFELLPEVYETGDHRVGLFIMLGLLLQIVLEFGSQGVEHGHMHHEGKNNTFPFALLISLCIHAFLEGFPLNTSEHLIYGVIIHKIPVAAILSTFLIHSGLSKTKVYIFLAIFALMTPLGSWVQLSFEGINEFAAYINAVVIGIFLHVSTTILFEASKNHTFNASKLAVIIFGVLLAYLL